MSSLASPPWAEVVAASAVSALGVGSAAYAVDPYGEPARTAIRRDALLAEAGLVRPNLARAAWESSASCDANADRATLLLTHAFVELAAELERKLPGWRTTRIGIAVGTSSGGMLSAERFFASPDRDESAEGAHAATYYAPLDAALARVGLSHLAQKVHVVAACASSTIALGLGLRWLQRDGAELVIAGGYDAVSTFVAAGFEALKATTATSPRPFRTGRDGMALGEGAGLVALVRKSCGDAAHGAPGDSAFGNSAIGSSAIGNSAPGSCATGNSASGNSASGVAKRASLYVAGFGCANDASHITAPDPEGGGLIRAGRAALADAGLDGASVELVSAHGTATPFNDSAEARAIAALCPNEPVVHALKAQLGHTLGAAGVLESLAAFDALDRGLLPASAGDGPLDSSAQVRLLERSALWPGASVGAGESPARGRTALKLSAAFGGITAALVLTNAPCVGMSMIRATRPVRVVVSARVAGYERAALAASVGLALDRLARLDDLGLLGLAAVAALRDEVGAGALHGAGIVAGHALATLDVNARFYERLVKKGPRFVDPRLFPLTSPNAGAGHAAIAFGLTGPSFAVNAGLDGGLEALAVAAELVRSGDAERMIVLAADDVGPAATAWLDATKSTRRLARGAVAVLLAAGAGELEVPRDLEPGDADRAEAGHLGLSAWLACARSPAIPLVSGERQV